MIREHSDTERADWLQLSRTENIGPVAFRELIRRHHSARAALDALPTLSCRNLRIAPRREVESELRECERHGIRMLASCEPDYPDLLRHADPPPPVIFVRGRVELLHGPCVAVVGSRNASPNGLRLAATLSRGLADAGQVVVSGLARGLDAEAHRASLPRTVAVLAGGVLDIYPKQNSRLYDAIAESGAIVSERPLHYRAGARDFPRRNRIISGLSRGTLVVEAAERSGSLITARYALEQNRDVMACPGAAGDERSKGCNRLIREGAVLVETVGDVLEVISDHSPLRTASSARKPLRGLSNATDTLRPNQIAIDGKI